MRKIPALLATLGLAGLGTVVPATGAQAAAGCDDAWHNASSGYFYAYRLDHCVTQFGRSTGNDSDWNASGGGFVNVSNRVNSILHKGTSGMAVKVYDGTGYTGAYGCIKKSEYYVSILGRNHLSGGGPGSGQVQAHASISSHKWVWESECHGNFLQ